IRIIPSIWALALTHFPSSRADLTWTIAPSFFFLSKARLVGQRDNNSWSASLPAIGKTYQCGNKNSFLHPRMPILGVRHLFKVLQRIRTHREALLQGDEKRPVLGRTQVPLILNVWCLMLLARGVNLLRFRDSLSSGVAKSSRIILYYRLFSRCAVWWWLRAPTIYIALATLFSCLRRVRCAIGVHSDELSLVGSALTKTL
ncbi:hypothetical protein L9F63_001901, partial [Diploptera punctata]